MNRPASIADVVAAEGGEVTFARFMELALTHPELGYYSQAGRLLRHGGDFNTAPALSPFFNETLARLVTELADAALSGGDGASAPPRGAPVSVVELGGGEGQLATAILSHWEATRPDWRERVAYRIVEVGARLQERQAEAVAGHAAAGWSVGWGATLAEACAGTRPLVVLGNEFVDALPVHIIRVAAEVLSEACVRVAPSGLEQIWGPLSAEAAAELEALFGPLDPPRLQGLTADGVIEVRPGLARWVSEVSTLMPAGSLVSIDYGEWCPGVPRCGERWGFEGRARRAKTARGYFKHQLVVDPLARPGRQDLTADVDFAALDLHGRRQGFETVVFTTLAVFLRGGGAEAELQRMRGEVVGDAPCTPDPAVAADPLEADRQATVLENLLDERDLGAAFKVMVQVRE